MAKINTVANNGLTIIENYNKLLEQIRKAKTIDDVRILVASTRDFISVYKRVDKNMVNEIYEKLQGKLHDMVAENAFVYDRMNNRVEEIRNRGYDYANEKDDTQAVQSKALQLMSQMPKVMNSNHANRITKVLTDSINSGVIGSKAVLELLKYPAYRNTKLTECCGVIGRVRESRNPKKVIRVSLRESYGEIRRVPVNLLITFLMLATLMVVDPEYELKGSSTSE